MEISSLIKRLLTGLGLFVVISGSILIDPIGFFLLLLAVQELAFLEYQKLTRLAGFSIQKYSMHIMGILLILISFFIVRQMYSISILLLFIPLIPSLLFTELFRNSKTPFENISLSFLGVIWISLPLSLFLCIGFLPFHSNQYHPQLVLGYFIILWCADSGAYLSGRLAGKRKLFHRISPGKTWEGCIGGFASAWIAGYLNSIFLDQLRLDQWLLLALIIAISGTFGDLTKSMLKRNVGVKDSGTILPGHGGILDRFDSLLGSAPFAFIYLLLYV